MLSFNHKSFCRVSFHRMQTKFQSRYKAFNHNKVSIDSVSTRSNATDSSRILRPGKALTAKCYFDVLLFPNSTACNSATETLRVKAVLTERLPGDHNHSGFTMHTHPTTLPPMTTKKKNYSAFTSITGTGLSSKESP
jgi:hypothetical protein